MNILYMSSVAYGWLKQRPQFVCEELSKKHKVCYTSFTPLGKKKDKTKKLSANLSIKDLYVLPFALKSKAVRALNKLFINLVLKIKKYDIVVVTHPLFYCYLPKKCKVMYECMDNMTAFYTGNKKEFVKSCEQKLCDRCKSFITSSEKLKEKLICDYNVDSGKITVINNALDRNKLSADFEKINLKKPNLVYIGTVDSWFDFETVSYYCKNHPESFVYIVGKVNSEINAMDLPDNMIFTGKVEHEKVFSYVNSADVVILPFKVNELIEYVDPVKMYEYLSLNKTVISSYWKELEKFEGVHFYKTKEEFQKLSETLPAEDTNVNWQFAEENCWEKRVQMYESVLTNK